MTMTYGGFHKWGTLKMMGVTIENPIQMDDLGALGVPPIYGPHPFHDT